MKTNTAHTVLPGKIIGTGRTAEIREWSDDRVIKIYNSDMPENVVRLEFDICGILTAARAPSPRCYEIIRFEDGREGLVFDRIHGKPLGRTYYSEIARIGRNTDRLVSLHRSVQIPLNAESALPSMKERIIGAVKALNALTGGEKEKIIGLTEQLPEGRFLCHGDFHPDNVMIENGKAQVIDWMTACTGPRIADAVRTAVLWRFVAFPDSIPKIARPFLESMTKILGRKYLKQYLKASGISWKEVEPWILPLAAARLIEGFSGAPKRRLIRFIRQKLRKH